MFSNKIAFLYHRSVFEIEDKKTTGGKMRKNLFGEIFAKELNTSKYESLTVAEREFRTLRRKLILNFLRPFPEISTSPSIELAI